MKLLFTLAITSLISILTPALPSGSTHIYSGQCACYRKTWVDNNKEQYQPIFNEFAKVIIDASTHKFTLYFNGDVVFSGSITYNKSNTNEGVEDYVVNGGLQTARRSIAEKNFTVDIPKRKSDSKDILGYEFIIQPYKEDSM